MSFYQVTSKCEGSDLVRDLVRKYHSPLYVFEEDIIRYRCQELKNAVTYKNTVIRYACKALTLRSVLQIIRGEGIWIDASSLNEVKRALLAGYTPSEILYTGENCSELVFKELLDLGVSINCSSLDQLHLLGRLAEGSKVSVRFNPGEGHGANNKINTGGPSSKHGVYFDQVDQVKKILRQYSLKINGIHTHIGSGTDLAHWLRIKNLTFEIAKNFSDLDWIDLGGGIPVVYNPEEDKPLPLKEWGSQVTAEFEKFCAEYGKELQLQIEPGRFLVAECGSLLAEVQNLKRTPAYNFVILNTGFNHNPRPAMYGSFHPISFVAGDGRTMQGEVEYVVAGYLCESGDVFTVKSDGTLAPRKFPQLQLGDIMVMRNVGAYSHSMKSSYNSMNYPPSLLLQSDGSVRVIERRGTLEDIIRREVESY